MNYANIYQEHNAILMLKAYPILFDLTRPLGSWLMTTNPDDSVWFTSMGIVQGPLHDSWPLMGMGKLNSIYCPLNFKGIIVNSFGYLACELFSNIV